MAITAENSARDFYTSLAKKFPKHEALFDQLATDEKNHAKVYTDLLKTPEVYSTEEERMQADFNIRALENEGVTGNLRGGAERAKEVSTLKLALEAAVQLEKDTLLFYSSLSMGLGSQDRREIYKIIQVEHAHLYKVQHITL